jgi:hypothetical protein
MHRHLSALLILLMAAASSCAETRDPEQLARDGVAAFNAKDYGPAYSQLHKAAAELPSDHPRSLEARVCLCRTLVHRDPDLCVDAFSTLCDERGDLEVQDVELITRDLIGAGAHMQASEVLGVAIDRFESSNRLHLLLDEAGDAAKQAGDHEALNRLKGLGYT